MREGSRLVWVGVGPRRTIKKLLLMVVAWAALVGLTAVVVISGGLYYRFSHGLPEIPRIEEYWPPIVTEIYTDDAVLAGEFYNERRKVVPYERIPKRLVQAFIASEDAGFFDHQGVDFLGTARAAFKTLMRKASGSGSIQGGSTITQQTAKAVLISAEGYKISTERSVVRKIREAILAHRLEVALTKEEILYLYLNNVYLGHHSYGVQAAAENYYRKDVRDLSLAEMALIAGLPQAPSRYSPFLNPDAAKKRRAYVLRRMFEVGMISKREHDQANADQVKVYPVEDVFHEFAPYFVEQIRKDVVSATAMSRCSTKACGSSPRWIPSASERRRRRCCRGCSRWTSGRDFEVRCCSSPVPTNNAPSWTKAKRQSAIRRSRRAGTTSAWSPRSSLMARWLNSRWARTAGSCRSWGCGGRER